MKRYTNLGGALDMIPDENGEYVPFTDVEAVLVRLKELEDMAREVSRLHAIYAPAKDLSWSQYMTIALDNLSAALKEELL